MISKEDQLAAAVVRFPVGRKVFLSRVDRLALDYKTTVTSSPTLLGNGHIVVGVACTTATVGIDRIRER